MCRLFSGIRHFAPGVISACMLFTGCSAADRPGEGSYTGDRVLITSSAAIKGWRVLPAPNKHTILATDGGDRFDMGETPYPHLLEATLIGVNVPNADPPGSYLLLYIPPVLPDEPAVMPIFYIRSDGTPERLPDLRHRHDWEIMPDTIPARVMIAGGSPRGEIVRDLLWGDPDGDGVDQLLRVLLPEPQ